MKPRRRLFTRRRLIALAILVLLMGFAAGGYWLLKRGKQRTDVYGQAVAAVRAERYDDAERLLQQMLESDETDTRARSLLIDVYGAQRRFDEAEAVALRWLELGRDPAEATMRLSRIALLRGRLGEAQRLARSIADRRPEFALKVVISVQDAAGTFAGRFTAQRAATALANLTERPTQRASSLLFATNTLYDLADMIQVPGDNPEAAVRLQADREALLQRARQYLRAARGAVEEGRARGLSDEGAERILARIDLFSEDDWQRDNAVRVLQRYVDDEEANSSEVISLARHHIRRQEWERARDLLASLDGRPAFEWLRAVRHLASLGRTAEVLALLPEADDVLVGHPVLVVTEAQALLAGSEEQRQRGVELLESLLEREDVDDAILEGAVAVLQSRGLDAAASRYLRTLSELTTSSRVRALAASVSDEPIDVRRIAEGVRSVREGIQVIRILGRHEDPEVGVSQALEYLQEQIDLGGELESRYHVLRAVFLIGLPEGPLRTEDRLALAREDLAWLDRPGARKQDLSVAWRLASTLDEAELAGRLAAAAMALPGEPEHEGAAVVTVAAQSDAQRRAGFAEGLRTRREDPEIGELVGVLSDAFMADTVDLDTVRPAIDALADQPDAKATTLLLAIDFALRVHEEERVASLAGRLLAMRPESSYARIHTLRPLVLRVDGDIERALEIAVDPLTDSFDLVDLRAAALVRADRHADARALFRAYMGAKPTDPLGYLALAGLHMKSGQPERAIATLAVAPATRDVLVTEAFLLEESGDEALAEQTFMLVVAKWPAEIRAWRGLSKVMIADDRETELINLLGSALDRVPLDHPFRADLLGLRAAAYREAFDNEQALADYEAALAVTEDKHEILNNAAWFIVDRGVGNPNEAERLISRAIDIAPQHPEVWHTGYKVALTRGDKELALDRVTEATLRADRLKAQKLRYLHDHAELLDDLDREEAAIKVWQQLVDSAPDEPSDAEKELLEKARERLKNGRSR